MSSKTSRPRLVLGSHDSPQSPTVEASPMDVNSELRKQFLEAESQGVPDTHGMEFKSPVFIEDSEDEVDGPLIDSNKFLYGVFIACVVVQV